MKKLIISKDFTLEDIRKIREYNYEMTKNMTKKERTLYNRKKDKEMEELFYKEYKGSSKNSNNKS